MDRWCAAYEGITISTITPSRHHTITPSHHHPFTSRGPAVAQAAGRLCGETEHDARATMEDGMAQEQGGITDNKQQSRYELEVEGGTAVLQYMERDGALYLTHTEVPPELEGQGIGGRIVKHALDDARSRGVKVAPWCPFVRAYVERHPEYKEIVLEEE
jgi:predicted GNAT family acetyltransferase